MSDYRRYCLTLTVVDQSQREKFRKLSRPDTFFEIRPNREVGERGAYSVEMTDEEYREARRDAESPFSNLLVVELDGERRPVPSVPGSTALTYLAAGEADASGLTGEGVVVGDVDTGLSQTLASSVFSGRIKAAKSFATGGTNYTNPLYDSCGHGSEMAGLATPPAAQLAVAKAGEDCFGAGDSDGAAAVYWLADEVGVDVILCEFQLDVATTVLGDAVRHAISKNILVVCPAGNGGLDNEGGPGENVVVYPAGYSGVMAISNYVGETDTIDVSSNYGNHLFAAACGSPLNYYTTAGSEAGETNGSGGTSAAAAMATGIVARFLSGNVSPGNVKSYLASTARRTGASPVYEGNGVLQLSAAYNKLKDDEAPPSNTDGSIPLPTGGRVRLPALTGSYVDPNLPSNTTVYPTSPATYSGTGDFVLPDGGYAQLDSSATAPDGWPATGNLSLSSNSEVTGVSPDAIASGYCPDEPC